jgi:di/tricarboxylate transporter
MGVAINSGISAGGYAPTSLFGIVSYRVAREAGIELSPYTLLGIAILANLVLLIAALFIFGSVRQPTGAEQDCLPQAALGNGPGAAAPVKLRRHQIATMVCMVGLVVSVIACAVKGVDPDVGVIAFGFGALLTLMDPSVGARAFTKIDWSTIFMVGGIVTFVGVLQELGSVYLLGHAALNVGTPLIAAVLICAIAGLASAFASTTGILAALVPMAVPLAASGQIAGWALICALCVCASIVDVSPFSTTGATLVATAAEEERSRLRLLLARWGMSMVVVGPLVLVPLLVILSS